MMLGNKLSKRIQFLLNLCDNFNTYADVGCDHGYVAYKLLTDNKTNFVYCVDIHKQSLEKTKILLEQNNLQNKAKLYCSDGFSELTETEKNNIDCAVIAGMGGNETIKILNVYEPKNLILQPMHNQKELREFLLNKGYNIKIDTVFCEKNKFYTFLVCEKSKNIGNYSNFELQFGKISNNTDYISYLTAQKEKYTKIYNKKQDNSVLNILQNIENVLK